MELGSEPSKVGRWRSHCRERGSIMVAGSWPAGEESCVSCVGQLRSRCLRESRATLQ